VFSTALTEADIQTALRDCFDPEVPLNIVDLGLVQSVAVREDTDAPGAGIPGVPPRYEVALKITPTSRGCPAQGQITAQIENRLAGMPQISRTRVEIVWEPMWTPQRISPAGRQQLGLE
jgi:metal-sulfur cluster biosynthetic enzyme